MAGSAQNASKLPVDFVIVGAQRAGSTFFADLVSQHPSIFIPTLELPVFEKRFFDTWDPRILDRFLSPGRGKTVGIKRPDSLGSPGVAANIAQMYPYAKIVVVLRDPVRRLISAAHWYMYTRLIPVEDLATLTSRLQRVAPEWKNDEAADNPYVQLLRFGAYAWCLESYLKEFSQYGVYIVFNDHLRPKQRRDQELHRFWEYLNLPPHTGVNESLARANAVIYDLRRLAFLSRRPVTFNWESQDRIRYVRQRHLRHPLRAFANAGFQLIDRALLSRIWRQQQPKVPPEAEAWLIDFYRKDVASLQNLASLPQQWIERYLPEQSG